MALVWLSIYFSIWLMILVLKWYFEITFISRKKGLCWPSVWDYLLFDIRSAQSTKRFYVPRFEMIYDCHFEMRGTKFSYTKLFSSGEPQIFYWRKHPIIYIFRTQLFAQCLCPYTCVEIYFKKGDGLLCQILIILQC